MQITPHILKGTVNIPSSKSEVHRAVICASLAKGRSKISNVTLSDDIFATVGGLRAMGADIKISREEGTNTLVIETGGFVRNEDKEITIDCHESGSTLRFLIPVALSIYDKVTFTGKGRLAQRPLNVYFDLFDKNSISYEHGENYLPLTVRGTLATDKYEIAGNISSQFVTGLMLASGINKNNTEISIAGPLESQPYIEITRDIMKRFGVESSYNKDENKYSITSDGYKSADFKAAGDWSHAGFWLLAGANSQIRVKGLDRNSKQGDKAIVEILKSMGADIYWEGDVLASKKAGLKGKNIDVSQCPDLAPVIAGAMAIAEAISRITGGERLKIKESDRIQSIVNTILSLGGKTRATDDGMVIDGKGYLSGGKISCYNDHRIAMMAGALSVYCEGQIDVDGYECVAKSYPEFWEHFKSLGGKI